MNVARKRGISFGNALGQLLHNKTLSKTAISVKNLNFANPDVRGTDLQRSLLYMGNISKNEFSFRSNLRALVGAKDDYNLEKKIVEFEFSNPALLVCAVGTLLSRLEMRYILNGIDFREAYARKLDQFLVLQAISHDIYEFGIDKKIMNYLFQFTSEIVDPSFDLECIKEKNVQHFRRNDNVGESEFLNNNNNNNNDDGSRNDTSNFTFDGREINYNIDDQMGCTVQLSTPIFDLYKIKRQHFGVVTSKDTIYAKFSRGEKIEFCSNGACWNYNFGHSACPFAKQCLEKSDAHLNKHYCGNCDGNHPIIKCVFLRSFMAIVNFNEPNWFSKSYDLSIKKLFIPNYKRNKNSSNSYNRSSRYDNNNNKNYDTTRNIDSNSNDRFGSYYSGYNTQPNSDFNGFSTYNNNNNNSNFTSHASQTPYNGNNRSSRRGNKNVGNRNNGNNNNNNNYNGGAPFNNGT